MRFKYIPIFFSFFVTSTYLHATNIQWSGYDWTIAGGHQKTPGPNNWLVNHVWIDKSGALNLRIDAQGAAGVMSQDKLGFGTYTWVIEGDLCHLDPNIVMGMFQYPDANLGPDTTHEIDIEIAKWGDAKAQRLHYSVWPNHKVAAFSHDFKIFTLRPGRRWTFTYTRKPSSVDFGAWAVASNRVSNAPMQVHMNLWAYKGQLVKPATIRILAFHFQHL
jgi:hypothetical protein